MKEKIKAIHQKALSLAKSLRKIENELLEVLTQVEDNKVYQALGYSSLFRYCTDELKLSEAQSYQYIGVARKSKQVPELKKAIKEEKLSVSKAKKICSVITAKNQQKWIEAATTLPIKQIEREVAKINPQSTVQERIKPVAGDVSELRCPISSEVDQMLVRIKDLVSQKLRKPAKMNDALKAMAELYLEKQDPIRKAQRNHNKKPRQLFTRTVGRKAQTRAVLAPIKHPVMLRDQGQCTHKDNNGRRCQEKRWLELHHIKPVSMGGVHSIVNLTTLCSHHHKQLHERPFQLE